MKTKLAITTITTLLIVMLYSCSTPYPKESFKQGELLYNPQFAKNEVEVVGNILIDAEYFTDERQNSIVLEKKDDSVYLRLVVEKRYHYDTSYDFSFRELQEKIQSQVFPKSWVYVELCHRDLQVKRRVINQ